MSKFFLNLLKWLVKIWQVFFPPKIEEVEFIPPKPMTNEEKFLKVCMDALDTDVTPKDNVPDYIACAETMSTLIKKILPDFPILASTKDLDHKMFMDKRFKRCDLPCRGRIIVSPRTKKTNGHIGIFLTNDLKIASNNSYNGKFDGQSYTWDEWIKEFKYKRKLRIYIYEIQD